MAITWFHQAYLGDEAKSLAWFDAEGFAKAATVR